MPTLTIEGDRQYAAANEKVPAVDTMMDVEARIEEANIYKAILSNTLFNSDNPVAKRVEEEVRNFVRSKLKTLLNLSGGPVAPAVGAQFTANEVATLKALAGLSPEELEVIKNLAKKVLGPKAPTMNAISFPSSNTVVAAAPIQTMFPQKQQVSEPTVVQSPPEQPKHEVVKHKIEIGGQMVDHEFNVTRQTLPPGYKPMSPREQAAYIEMSTLSSGPSPFKSGSMLDQIVISSTGGNLIGE